jgi:hypothetical protein
MNDPCPCFVRSIANIDPHNIPCLDPSDTPFMYLDNDVEKCSESGLKQN